jgi:succinyl-diaminopimelate desuccinylase
LDTAPFGDIAAWRHPPTSGTIEDGWLYGRDAADSKAAIAIFLHLAMQVKIESSKLAGTLTLLFDADEHTGRFGGAKTYFSGPSTPRDVAGVMIGYPGIDQLVVGGRGFLRADITVHGQAGHTGSQRAANNENAVEKTAELVREFAEHRSPATIDPTLGLSPKLTVTAINGGESYSTIPDHCTVKLDTRLTHYFDEKLARELIQRHVDELDSRWPTSRRSEVVFHESWPAYHLAETSPVRVALTEAARRHLPNPVVVKVAGPSNIGNYLASLGIDATAGLGARFEGLHGADERIELASIPAVYATYCEAVTTLLQPS